MIIVLVLIHLHRSWMINKEKLYFQFVSLFWFSSSFCLSSYLPVDQPQCVCTQSYLTLCSSVDCSPSGSSVLGVFQSRILEWVAISFSRGSSRPRDWAQVSCISRWNLYFWPVRVQFKKEYNNIQAPPKHPRVLNKRRRKKKKKTVTSNHWETTGISLVVQWLFPVLPMKGT